MRKSFTYLVVTVCLGLLLLACQPVQPPAQATQTDSGLATYSDPDGLFSLHYPAGWIAEAYIFGDDPIPHVGLGSHQQILDLSTAEEFLPEDQIGVAIMLMPRELLAEAGVTADTPLDEVLQTLLLGMDEEGVMQELLANAQIELDTLPAGTEAARVIVDGPTEAYEMTLADLENGLYLVAFQIQALGHHNAELEVQVDAIIDSVVLTGSADDVLAKIMEKMGALSHDASTEASAPTVSFTATEYAYEGPEVVAAGLTRIEFVNAGAQEHMLWMVRLDKGRTIEDFMGVLAAMETDPALPEWMAFYGGVTAGPGDDTAYTVDLVPGHYVLFSFSTGEDGEPDVAKGMLSTLTVTENAASDAAAPVADVHADLVDFSFVIEGDFTAGPQMLEVTNTGMEPHELVLIKLDEGIDLPDALEMMMAEEEMQGPPPFQFVGGVGPMHAGLTAWYEVDLEAGTYGMICFIPSPANEGAPHFMLGMTGQVTVAP